MKKILILEDSPGLQRVILTKLKHEGYDVFAVDNVCDAMDTVKSDSDYTLFWLSHSLVGSSTGLDFLKKVRLIDVYKDTPAVLISNTEFTSELEQYMEAGLTKHYQKSKYTVSEIIDDLKSMF